MENQCCFHIPVLHDGETPLAWQSPGEEALCLVEQQVNGGEWKTAYLGKCETVPAPAVGRTWQTSDADGLSWLQCETADRDWRAWEARCETLLDWAGRDARLQTWSQWEAVGESWAARDAAPADADPHSGCTVTLPHGARTAAFRLQTGSGTQWKASAVTDALRVRQTLSQTAAISAGQPLAVQAVLQQVQKPAQLLYTLLYDPSALRLTYLAAGSAALAEGAPLKLLAHTAGRLTFCTPAAAAAGAAWSGPAFHAGFTARRTGSTVLTLMQTVLEGVEK